MYWIYKLQCKRKLLANRDANRVPVQWSLLGNINVKDTKHNILMLLHWIFLLIIISMWLSTLIPVWLSTPISDDQHDFKNVVPLVIVISILLKIRCVRLLETKEEYLGNRKKRLQGKVRHYVNKYPVVLPVHLQTLIVVELQKILCCCCSVLFLTWINKWRVTQKNRDPIQSHLIYGFCNVNV